MRTTSRLFGAGLLAATAALFLLAAPAALASAHGQLLHLSANANQSTNWFGYVQGTLEQGGKQFNSIGGDWTVPSVTQHSPGQEEFSSDWIGIGGGCVDAGCAVTDGTLIQASAEQEVDAARRASYSACWEVTPGAPITITNLQ